MRFAITEHARESMALRRISEAVVREVLARPSSVVAGNRPGRDVVEGLATVGDPPFRALLRIVVDRNVSPPAVITVYATTRFKRYGVKP